MLLFWSLGCLVAPALVCARHSHSAAHPPLDDLRRRITPVLGIPRCIAPLLDDLRRGHSLALGCVGSACFRRSTAPVLGVSGKCVCDCFVRRLLWPSAALAPRALRRLAAWRCVTTVFRVFWCSAALVISRSRDQPLWRSAALAISCSGDQSLWRSVALAISRSGDQSLW